jgi:hypothetical protein
VITAGADVRVITPQVGPGARPVFLAGFQGNRRATGIDTDLYVRTLALLEEDGRPFALAVCDLIGVLRPDTLAVRRAVADLDADVVVAATHTHSGPDTIGLWGPDEGTSGIDEAWLAGTREAIAASIRSAVAALEPASMRVATASVTGVIRNYRDPEIVDTEIAVLALDRPDGSAIATLMNVPVHPEVLNGDSTVVGGDMAGAGARALEAARGGAAVWAGAGMGGMQSPEEGPRTPAEAQRKGRMCAEAALAALARAPSAAEPRVRVRSAEVELPLWNPRFRAGIGAGLLRGDVSAEGTLRTDVALVDLGLARMACWPGEVLPALGMESKARIRTPHAFLIGLANDELGYILPEEDFVEPEDWDDPGRSYEESMSVGPETGSRLMAALDALAL